MAYILSTTNLPLWLVRFVVYPMGGQLKKGSVPGSVPHLRESDHLLGFNVPNLQTEATRDFDGIERRSLGRLQLRYTFEDPGNR